MSAPVSPVDQKQPHRTTTVNSTTTASTVSDDEAVFGDNTSETTRLLLERLQAWKHMCCYLEDYIETTAKVQKSHSKEYEKVLKTISKPLKEAHHFDQNLGGIAGLFENLRNNTQGISNMCVETDKSLRGSVLLIIERLHKEIKNKGKELKSGAGKSSKAVDKARAVTQKHIELLGQYAAAFDSAAASRVDSSHDPFVLRREINYCLNKQLIEENTSRQDTITVQESFQQFEAHVIRTVQNAMQQFYQYMSGQNEYQRSMYADVLANTQKIPLDYEWTRFVKRNNSVLVDPDVPPRSLSNISFPNEDHRSTKPFIEGTLDRKSRALVKGYNTGYYVVSPARYLHEFKDNDDFHREPKPELSLYLPDCVIGALDGVKFHVKGKDISGGKVTNTFHTMTELSFKAHTATNAEKWWTVIKETISSPGVEKSSPVSPTLSPLSPLSPAASATSPLGKEANDAKPQVDEKDSKAAAEVSTQDYAQTVESPKPVSSEETFERSASNTSHYHVSPGGTRVATQ